MKKTISIASLVLLALLSLAAIQGIRGLRLDSDADANAKAITNLASLKVQSGTNVLVVTPTNITLNGVEYSTGGGAANPNALTNGQIVAQLGVARFNTNGPQLSLTNLDPRDITVRTKQAPGAGGTNIYEHYEGGGNLIGLIDNDWWFWRSDNGSTFNRVLIPKNGEGTAGDIPMAIGSGQSHWTNPVTAGIGTGGIAGITNGQNGISVAQIGLTNGILSGVANIQGNVTDRMGDTNASLLQYAPDGWQRFMARVPKRGFGGIPTEAWAANYLNFITNNTQYKGWNIFAHWQHIYSRYRTNGHLAWNNTNFPMGWSAYTTLLSNNNIRFMMWYDDLNAAPGDPVPVSEAQYRDDIETIVRDFQPDILWVAEDDRQQAIAADIIRTNKGKPIEMMYNVVVHDPSHHFNKFAQMGSSWRFVNNPAVDITDWAKSIQAMNQYESDGWWRTGPGQSPYFGPEIFEPYVGITVAEQHTRTMWAAMCSSDWILNWAHSPYSSTSIGWWPSVTNLNVQELQGDVAVAAPRRVFQTNGCHFWLKPLGTYTGPNYALQIINTNGAVGATVGATNASVTLNQLNSSSANAGMFLRETNYSVYELMSGTLVGHAQNVFSVASLCSHSNVIYKLVPSYLVTNTFSADTVIALVSSAAGNVSSFTARGTNVYFVDLADAWVVDGSGVPAPITSATTPGIFFGNGVGTTPLLIRNSGYRGAWIHFKTNIDGQTISFNLPPTTNRNFRTVGQWFSTNSEAFRLTISVGSLLTNGVEQQTFASGGSAITYSTRTNVTIHEHVLGALTVPPNGPVNLRYGVYGTSLTNVPMALIGLRVESW